MPHGIPNPTVLYRVRDGVYAADLLIAAVARFDLFSWLDGRGPVPAEGVWAWGWGSPSGRPTCC